MAQFYSVLHMSSDSVVITSPQEDASSDMLAGKTPLCTEHTVADE